MKINKSGFDFTRSDAEETAADMRRLQDAAGIALEAGRFKISKALYAELAEAAANMAYFAEAQLREEGS